MNSEARPRSQSERMWATKVVGHLRQRKLGDVEPLTGDETQEQVERPLGTEAG